MRRTTTACSALVAAALVFPGNAGAHARVIRSEPADGVVLARAPARARVVFDDAVRVGPRVAAVRSDGTSVLGGPARVVSHGDRTDPLRHL